MLIMGLPTLMNLCGSLVSLGDTPAWLGCLYCTAAVRMGLWCVKLSLVFVNTPTFWRSQGESQPPCFALGSGTAQDLLFSTLHPRLIDT